MRFLPVLLLLIGFSLNASAADTTLTKYKELIIRDFAGLLEKNRGGSKQIIQLSYDERPRFEQSERVLDLYRRQEDKNIWDFNKMGTLNTYLQKFKDSTDVDFYIILASVYKYYNVDDDPTTVYKYENLNAAKKTRQQEVKDLKTAEDLRLEQREGGSSKKFLAFSAKAQQVHATVLGNGPNGRRVFALLVVSSFYPNTTDATVGKVLHSFAVLHDKFNYNAYEFEEFVGMFLGNRNDFNLGVFEKEEKLGQYIRLMFDIKQGNIVPETGTYKKLGRGIPKKKIKAGSYLEEFIGKVGTGYKPSPVPMSDPNPFVRDHTGALTPFEINQTMAKFQQMKSEKGYVLKTIITDYATPYSEITVINNYVKQPAADDMILWVHFNKDKDPEFGFFYGSNIGNKKELNLLETFIVEIFGGLDINPFTAILDGLAAMIGELKISERYYNPEHPDYNSVPGDIYEVVTLGAGMPLLGLSLKMLPGFPAMESPYGRIRTEFATICGAWNGVVDLLAGIPEFASLVIKLCTSQEARNGFVEGWNKMKEKGVLKSIKQGFVESHTGNACKVGAQIGHDVIDILSIAIAFAKVGAAAKIAALLDALDISTYVLKFVGTVIRKTAGLVVDAKKFIFKLGTSFYRLHDINGVPLLQVASNNVENLFQTINWSLYPNPVQLVGPDGKTYTVLMHADEALNVPPNNGSIVELMRREDGSLYVDEAGNGLGKTNTNEWVPIRNVLETSGHLVGMVNTLKSKYAALGAKLEALLPDNPKLVQDFLNDFAEKDEWLARFNKAASDPDALNFDAWEVFYKAGRTELRKSEANLKKLSDLLANNNFGDGVPWTKTEFENLFKRHGEYGRGGKTLIDEEGVTQIVQNSTLSAEALLDVLDLARRKPKPGMNKVLDKLCCSEAGKAYIGAEWQLRYAKDIWDDILEFETKLPPNVSSDYREVDILLSSGRRRELKSWHQFLSNYEAGFIEQFAKDLRDVANFTDLKWVFEKKGLFGAIVPGDGYKYLKDKVIDVLKRNKLDFASKVGNTKLQQYFGTVNIDDVIKQLEDDKMFKKLFEIN